MLDVENNIGDCLKRPLGVDLGFLLRNVFQRETYRVELWTNSKHTIFCHYLLDDDAAWIPFTTSAPIETGNAIPSSKSDLSPGTANLG